MNLSAVRDNLASHLTMLACDMATLAAATEERKLSHGGKALIKGWIIATYGNTCAWCGRDFPANDLQVGHLIPAESITPGARGKKRGGLVPGNIALTCKPCNNPWSSTDTADPYTMARPDLVPLAWPAYKVGSTNGIRKAVLA